MIVAVGVDSVAIARIARLLVGERFAARVFTAAERAYCADKAHPAQSFAARFCAKEAVMKCLQTGWGNGVAFADIEVLRRPAGDLGLALRGPAAERAEGLGIRRWHLSLTHTDAVATAFVVAEG